MVLHILHVCKHTAADNMINLILRVLFLEEKNISLEPNSLGLEKMTFCKIFSDLNKHIPSRNAHFLLATAFSAAY